MRIISTLCLFLFSSLGFSQLSDMIRMQEYENGKFSTLAEENKVQLCGIRGILSNPADLSTMQAKAVNRDTTTRIFIRCGRMLTSDNAPLVIIDGLPVLTTEMKNLNPNNIESIHILKDAVASAIYGCRASNGVIIIVTKQEVKLIIKDFLNGERIAGATVSFISADKRDTLMAQSDDSGVIVTDKLKYSVGYSINISSVGYQTLSQTYNPTYRNRKQEILLERDLKVCNEVVLPGGQVISCGRNYSVMKISSCRRAATSDTVTIVSDNIEKMQSIAVRIFPNPLPKGGNLVIETSMESEQAITIKIIGLDGKTLLSQPQKTIKGPNRFSISTDSRWAAGIYLVHLYANGRLLASSKLIVQ